jgi:hypothetical protein
MSVQDTKYVRGAERLATRIATIRSRLNLPKLTDEIGDLLLRRTDRRFDTETDPDGNRWRELTDATKRRKQAAGAGQAKILTRSGEMRGAIKKVRSLAGATFINTGAQTRIGIEDPKIASYARRHQQGLGLPVRRFLGVGAADVKAVDSLLRRKARELEVGA